jgi:DNA invertase Pin-like site-specific DNA recombinase
MAVKTFGYVRVSTHRQAHDRQDDALTGAGVKTEDIYRDTISGAKFVRAGLDALLRTAREGDTIVVTSLDRLGRSLSQVIATADELHQRGIVLRSMKESIDYSTSVGRMLAGIFGSLAEYERELINERAADARVAAKARGKETGRPPRLNDDQARQLCALHAGGETVADLCKSFKIGRATAYRVLERSRDQLAIEGRGSKLMDSSVGDEAVAG